MNKKIIISAITLILIILWLTWYYFKDNILNIKDNNTNTNSWKTVPEIITKNFDNKVHHLDLRTKKLSEMPNICEMVSWTNFEYDIWSIDLADNQIIEINSDLSCLKNLQDLNLSFNKIIEIDNLNKLNFIKKLDLWNNQIIKIDNLDNLKTLNDLHLWYNKLTSTSGLERLTNLTSLKLQHNEISDISYLKDLSKLEELKLEFNNLTEESLKSMLPLKKLKIITVAENPWISKETIDRLNEYSLKNIQKRDSENSQSSWALEIK